MLATVLSCDVPSIAFNVGNTVVLILLSAYVLYKIRSANLRKKRIAEHFEQKRLRALQAGAIPDGPLDATVVSVASASASQSGSGSVSKHALSSHAHSTNASVLSASSEAGSTAPVKDKLVFPIYFTFLKVACLLYIIRAILSTVGIVGNYSARSFAFVQVAFVHPLTVGVSEGLSFFLVLRSVGQDAIRKTSVFTALWIIAQMVEGIVFWVFDNDSGAADLNIPENVGAYWFSLDGVRVAFYGFILLYMACTRTKRLANYPYATFHLVCYSLSVLADTLYQTNHPGSDCILFTTWSIWTIVWPPLAYYTLRMDSRYWSKIGKEAGAEASPAVRKRKKTDSKGKSRSRNNSLGSVGSAASRSPLLPILDDNMRGRKPPRGFIVDFSNLTFLEEIGAGGTSRVYRGLLRGQEVAIKQFRCEMLTPEYIQRFAMEMAIASRLVHKNIVQCLGVCVVPPSICMVSEFMERGSLFHVLGRYKGLSVLRRLDFALDAASAVCFLHEQRPRILHRDIKSLNFLIDRHWTLKLADLGEAREIGGDAIGSDRALTQERGTPQWMAPETFTSAHYTEKVDIYSLGIVFWEIATGMRPFSHLSPWLVPAAVLERHERPPLTGTVVPSIPLEFVHLIQRCWRTDPNVRPSAEQVVRELTVIRDQTAQLLQQSGQPASPAPPPSGGGGEQGPSQGPSESRPPDDDRKQRMSV